MKIIPSIVIIAILSLTAFPAIAAAAEAVPTSTIPAELIARNLKKHDPSLATSVEAVRYKLKRNQPLTLVDVRRGEDFERLHIPGSINIALYAVKTKSYLKSVSVVLVNEGFRYAALENECRRLAERGYKVTILDGGLPAWKRQGGLAGYQKYLEGLLLSWKPRDSRMKTVSNCKPCGQKIEEETTQRDN